MAGGVETGIAMKHPHSTCPAEPSAILAPFLLLLALIVTIWRQRRDPGLYRNGDRYVPIS